MIHIQAQHQIQKNASSTTLTINVDHHFCNNGDISGIFGQSGTGKSSLLKLMAGLLQGAKSHLAVNGSTYKNTYVSYQAHENPCVYVGSDSVLFEHLNVTQNLEIVGRKSVFNKDKRSVSAKLSKADVIHMCGISNLLHQYPVTLSTGEQQRVKFAMALMSGKQVLLLDEAFSALDWQSREHMHVLVQRLVHEFGFLIIMVSHSLKELSKCCKHITHFRQGQVVAQGSVDAMLDTLLLGSDMEEGSNTQVFSELKVRCVHYDAKYSVSKLCLLNIIAGTVTPNNKTLPHTLHQQFMFALGEYPHDLLEHDLLQHSVQIDADKISVSRQSNAGNSSMLNELQGRVHTIVHKDDHCMISLLVSGQILRVKVSLLSFNTLNIQKGETLYAQFKVL